MKQLYRDFGTWIRQQFDFRVQKISIDAGFTCPNRDGRISYGGCTFCNNQTFNPAYCNAQKTITQQLEEGKMFFGKKYPDMKYLAYFQAYSNTYASFNRLKSLYQEALNVEDVVGLVIGTRPDCVDNTLLDYLAELNKSTFLMVEYGIESANNETLRRINRGHTFDCAQQAIEATHKRGILTGAHIIIGLPGEDQNESIRQAKLIAKLPIDILKIHQMQIVKGTKLAQEYAKEPFHVYSIDEYVELIVQYIRYLRPDIIIERFVSQSPSNLLIAPKWGLKNHEFTYKVIQRLQQLNAYQGELYTNS